MIISLYTLILIKYKNSSENKIDLKKGLSKIIDIKINLVR